MAAEMRVLRASRAPVAAEMRVLRASLLPAERSAPIRVPGFLQEPPAADAASLSLERRSAWRLNSEGIHRPSTDKEAVRMKKVALRISMSKCGCLKRPLEAPNMMPKLSPKTT